MEGEPFFLIIFALSSGNYTLRPQILLYVNKIITRYVPKKVYVAHLTGIF